MNLFSKFSKKQEEIEEDLTPVSVEDVENLIKIIELADKIGATFDLCLILTIDGFAVDSTIFKGIKMVKKTKNEPDRLLISYYNALLSTETMINIQDIVHITLEVTFIDSNNRGKNV